MTTLQCLVALAALFVLSSWVALAAVMIADRKVPRVDHIGQLPKILFPSQN